MPTVNIKTLVLGGRDIVLDAVTAESYKDEALRPWGFVHDVFNTGKELKVRRVLAEDTSIFNREQTTEYQAADGARRVTVPVADVELANLIMARQTVLECVTSWTRPDTGDVTLPVDAAGVDSLPVAVLFELASCIRGKTPSNEEIEAAKKLPAASGTPIGEAAA